jgi:hypothetical protein
MKKRNKNVVIWIVVITVVVGLLGFNNFASIISGESGSTRTNRELALSCITHQIARQHIHPHLEIIIDGVGREVPANTGNALTCMRSIHTHDATGKLHIESTEVRDFDLSDFFAVWEQPFSKEQILDKRVDESYEIVLTVNGARSEDYEKQIMRDNDHIVIEYRQKLAN